MGTRTLIGPELLLGPDLAREFVIARLIAALSELWSQGPVVLFRAHCRTKEGESLRPTIALFSEYPGAIPEAPPLVTIEVLAGDETYNDVLSTLLAFERWGVKNIWQVSLGLNRLESYTSAKYGPVQRFELPEFGFTITYDQLVAGL